MPLYTLALSANAEPSSFPVPQIVKVAFVAFSGATAVSEMVVHFSVSFVENDFARRDFPSAEKNFKKH